MKNVTFPRRSAPAGKEESCLERPMALKFSSKNGGTFIKIREN